MRRPALFIAVYIVVQLALPLHYYTFRADKNDERFAWRMFSTTRMLRCEPTFTVGDNERKVDLRGEFHQAWLSTAQRGRIGVVEAMADALCDRNPGQSVRFELLCRDVAGKQHRERRYDACRP